MIRVADYIIKRISDKGIKHIFMITGRGILYLTDAVAKEEGIEGVSTYHEQGASYAAMAYAAARDGMSACLVSTGCAATNAVTAALCAFQDNLPVVFISGQNLLKETTRYTKQPIRTFGSQEADIIPVVESVTKYAIMLVNPEDVVKEIEKAFYLAEEGRKGPVWIDVPLDIQNARIEPDDLEHYSYIDDTKKIDKSKDITYVIDALTKAERPVVMIGGGVRSAKAIEDVAKFIDNSRIPVVFSQSAADVYGSGNELSIGSVGSLGGSRAGNFAVQNADVVLVIGSKLCSQTIGVAGEFAREAKIIVVDIDKNEHKKDGARIDRCINMDAKEFLQLLNESAAFKCNDEWINKCLKWKSLFAIKNETFIDELKKNDELDIYHFADVLSDKISSYSTIITDAGFEELIIPSTIRFHDEQRCLFPAAQGAMGYAIPAIIGAYYAGRKDLIVVVGDGSFMMNMQELLLIGKRQIPVTIFVINNNMYAVIRKRQKDLFRARTIGNDPSDGVESPDFKKIADSFDIQYTQIETEHELERGIEEVLKLDKPCICEVLCTSDQKYLHTSYAFNSKRRLVKRPLEDLSPFMERSVFESEMIIDPIEED